MKWLSNKYAYPLVIIVMIATLLLQLTWLDQLFKTQVIQVKRDLEQAVGNAAKMSTYLSEVPGHEKSRNFRDFFLSREWLDFRQAYNNMRFHNIGSRFFSDTKGDSTFVDISLRFLNGSTKPIPNRHVVRFDNNISLAVLKKADNNDFRRMDSLVRDQFRLMGIKVNYKKLQLNYDINQRGQGPQNLGNHTTDFKSQQYSYNLRFLNLYQLVVPSVTPVVLFRMRFHLVSSAFMIILTGAVFFFILRLMNNQRLYTEARLSFTSNMTHELKTPVATVAVALESIMENHLENDPETLRNYLDISRSELKRLNLMIDRVLNLEHLDHGKSELRKELFEIQPALHQIVKSLQLQLANAGAEIVWNLSETPCFVTGDTSHLINVFYNLIENALKYGGANVRLKISCAKIDSEVMISFEDNGPGIPYAYQDKVFERFFRVPGTTADLHNIKGTGLGLNYVKQIIEKHHGRIELSSKTGKGAKFAIFLPEAL
jgi:signal transduction histidine kinase